MEKNEQNQKENMITLDQQLCFEIYQAHKTYNRFYSAALQPYGLTYAQYIVMLSLYEFKTMSVKELGGKVALDSGTLTPLLRRLEKDDWVVKKRSTEDERRLEVSPSQKAWDLQDEIYERVGGCTNLLELSDKQYTRYKKEVGRLREDIQKASEMIDNEL